MLTAMPALAESSAISSGSGPETSVHPEDDGTLHSRWVALAESLKPTLNEEIQLPVSIVHPVADPSKYLRWRMDVVSPAAAIEEPTEAPSAVK